MASQPALSTAPQPGSDFPPRLDDVPVEARVRERFGWLAGAASIAAGFAAYTSIGMLSRPGKLGVESMAIEAGWVVGAIFFAWYEIWRRLRRTVLVPRGPRIGVYRRGALAIVIGQGSLAPYELHPFNTIRYLMLPVLLGPVLLLLGLAGVASHPGKIEDLLLTLAGAYVTSIAVSIVWTRIVCKHFHIPKNGGREEVVFTREDARRLIG